MYQPPLLGEGHPAQWEIYVKRAVRSGRPRKEVLDEMLKANWAEVPACQFIDQIISQQRWAATGMLIGFAVLGMIGLIGIVASFEVDEMEDFIELLIIIIITGLAGFFYGLGRMIKVSRTALSPYR
jgi:hypothetical protein